jgi:hypothetical protein
MGEHGGRQSGQNEAWAGSYSLFRGLGCQSSKANGLAELVGATEKLHRIGGR